MAKSTFTFTGTSLIEGVGGFDFPLTVTLKSADVTRLIEFSTDGGIEYFSPTIDVTTATMLVTSAISPITNIRATGIIGNTLTLVG